MKKVLKLINKPALLCLFLISSLAWGQTTISGWEMNGLSSYGLSPFTPSTSASNVLNSGLTRGTGITTVNTAAANTWGGNGMNTSSDTFATAANDFVFYYKSCYGF